MDDCVERCLAMDHRVIKGSFEGGIFEGGEGLLGNGSSLEIVRSTIGSGRVAVNQQ